MLFIYLYKRLPLSGTSYKDVSKYARQIFVEMKSTTKRKIHLKSAYFKKQKVFFDYFWPHLLEKRQPDRVRRLRLLPCAIEVIQKSKYKPEVKINPKNKKEMFYRFYGRTVDDFIFIVQIKQIIRNKTLPCISVFPVK